MSKRLSSSAVCKAVRYATAAGSRRAAFPTRRAVAEHYAVSPSTLARWVRDYAGLSVASVDKVRKPVGVHYRKSAQMYGISPRYADSPEGRTGKLIAWQVSICRGKRDYVRRFGVPQYGNQKAALRAALEWRDQVASRHLTVSKRELAARRMASNTSGVSGVSIGWVMRVRKDGSVRTYKHWVARKPKGLGGNMTQRTFGVLSHGEQQAFALAVKARKAWEAELKGRHVHHAGVGRLYAPAPGKKVEAHRRAASRAALMRGGKKAKA